MNRAEMVGRRAQRHDPWDIVVIGGGATGVGIAVDAASRGYDVRAARAARLRQGHVEPQHEARPRRRALPRAGQHLAGDGGPEGARHPAPERAAPGQQPGLRRAELRLVGGAVLRPGPEGLQRARRQVRLRRLADPVARRDAARASRRSRPRACAAAWSTTTASSTTRGC